MNRPAAICPTCGQAVDSAERQVRDAIKDALTVKGWTQVQLAEAAGITQKHLSQLLSGKSGLSFDMAEKLLGLLGASLTISTTPAAPVLSVSADSNTTHDEGGQQ